MKLSPPRHSWPADDAPPRRTRRHDSAPADDAPPRQNRRRDPAPADDAPPRRTRRQDSAPADDAPPRRLGRDEAAAVSKAARGTEGAEDSAPPLTRSRRRKHIRAAAGPRPYRPDPAAGRPARPDSAPADASPSSAPPAQGGHPHHPATPHPGPLAPRTTPEHPAPAQLSPPIEHPAPARAVSTEPAAEPDRAVPRPPVTEPDVAAEPAAVADRLPADDVADAAVAPIVARVGDATAPAHTGRFRALLTRRRHRRAQRGLRRAPSARPYLGAALLRCALYLGPLGVAVAAAGPLGRVGMLVPIAVLALGWSAAQALTCLGDTVARTSGTAAAARLVAGGFAAAAGMWCAFVWVAPSAWLGPDRMLAGVIGIGGLTALATVTAALVTRAETGVVRWSVPCWVLGGLSAASATGLIGELPIGTLLPAAIVVAAVRAYRPVIGRSVPRRKPLAAGDVRRAVGFLVAGAGQAVCVALLWRSGRTDVTWLAAIPLLLAVPALEVLVGWHVYQFESGVDIAGSSRDHRRHVRSIAVATVAALLPPLAAGIALAAVAYRLPYGETTRDGVLALAAGTLLGGLLAVTVLLAARGRTGTAATLAAVAPLAIMALPLLTPALAPLPTIVAVFAGAHLLGLLTVAHTATDDRRAT